MGGTAVEIEYGGHAIGEIKRKFDLRVEVDVGIGETWDEIFAGRVDPLRLCGDSSGSRGADAGDASVLNQYGLVVKDALTVHRNNVNVQEGGGVLAERSDGDG